MDLCYVAFENVRIHVWIVSMCVELSIQCGRCRLSLRHHPLGDCKSENLYRQQILEDQGVSLFRINKDHPSRSLGFLLQHKIHSSRLSG